MKTWTRTDITQRVYEITILDNEQDSCYSNNSGDDANGSKEASAALLEDLWDEEIQR